MEPTSVRENQSPDSGIYRLSNSERLKLGPLSRIANRLELGEPYLTCASADRTPGLLADDIASMRPRLLAVARSMRAAEPEDLVQATLEIALRHADQLRDVDRLWPWLVAIQTRELFRWTRRVRTSLWRRETDSERPTELRSFIDLRDALAALPPRTRASVVLHHMAALTVSETARALGTSENTVKTQLRNGMRQLKEKLK